MKPTRRDLLKAAPLAGMVPPLPVTARQVKQDIDRTDAWPPFQDGFMFEKNGISHPVFRQGEGPGVLLMHELPGMTGEFWRLAHWIREAGFTVYIPDLYGSSLDRKTKPSLTGNLIRSCISREIHLFARNASSPVTQWLRALAVRIHEEQGGPGVGAIGMCMTGNFALSLVLEDAVIAPVASQPAMPANYWTRKSQPALHMTEVEQTALETRTDIDVMGLRFHGDPTCRKARFDAIEALTGEERFRRIELEDSAQNPNGNPYPHAVLTRDLVDEEGSPTLEARDQVIAFLQEKLIPALP